MGIFCRIRENGKRGARMECENGNMVSGFDDAGRQAVLARLGAEVTEANLWDAVVAFQGQEFFTISGLPFTYTLRKGRNGTFTRELWIDRRENSKSLAWSSVVLAFQKVKDAKPTISRPKALGDIRGISYIYAIFLRFGLIEADTSNESSKRRR